MSFKQIKRKLKEYSKKKRKDTGLDYLKYGSVSKSDSKDEAHLPLLAAELEQEYQLPALSKALTLYNECVLRLNQMENKIMGALSSSPRKEYTVTIKAIKENFSLGSLHEMDMQNARASQVERHKAKLNARLIKVRMAREADLKKAKRDLYKAESAEKEALRVKGVAARAAERDRKKQLKALEVEVKKKILDVDITIPLELL
ncbi:hypothetical protein NA56DRAFT_706534 [Hyaloscypha hepaticicola]|uniref:Uncharacterized protein n=1 Tax=Hyaloscypha hepaticicola TaxID=2082293 RepID=A0A2J6PX55_9HELO|nr:hypothetical protein NA56DRAFT_706534 [Hyaloscypha hepaticicola]